MDMISWMTNQCLRDPKDLLGSPLPVVMANPVEALFRIIFLDTMMLSDVFDNTLQEIRLASLEDSKLQASIDEWRQMLAQAQLRLPTLQTSIADFIRDASDWPSLSESDTSLSNDFQSLVSRLSQRIAAVIRRTEKIDAALRAELSVLVSRKQLLESSSITKLTELAFVFIPLSFIASTFSMQVQELQPPPRLATFILAAFLAVVLAYVVRFFLNSRAFDKISRRTEQAVRRYSQVPGGQPVPTAAYVNFGVWAILFYFTSVYGIVLACLSAVVWLWVGQGHTNHGFKAALTVVVVLTLPLPAVVPVTDDMVPRWLREIRHRRQRQRQHGCQNMDPPPRVGLAHEEQRPAV